ncbi:MAG: SDR family oxidoreductase [Bacteroidales bacterium]|nr:SDR family oxidoreductase [Bacteroidales bacterium]
MNFEGKIIIITGASSGIGLASARLFASKGAKLILAARSQDKLDAISMELSCRTDVLCLKTDVSIEADCRNLVEKGVERFGGIDILINNAGLSMRAMFKDLDLLVIKNLMDVNFWGTVYCTKYALPYILKAHGSVVGVISIAGFAGLPARTGYSSSKYAIRGFLDTLRIEHLKDNLHVMVFAPGFTSSNIRNTALTADGSQQGETPRDEGKMMSANRVAEYLAKGISKRKSQMILTPIGKLTVFLSKTFPRLTDRLEYDYMSKEPNSPLK